MKVYVITYASYYAEDGEIFTKTNVIADKEKADLHQQINIRHILSDIGKPFTSEYANLKEFSIEDGSWTYQTKIEEMEVEQ